MFSLFSILVWLAGTSAHLSAFHPAMYCLNGAKKGFVNQNANDMVQPLFMLEYKDWWFHSYNGCSDVPPPDGTFLVIPAGGSFTVEIADNQAETSMSYGGRQTSAWPDGRDHPEFENRVNQSCITQPNMHTPNETYAAGTAFAIAYKSDLEDVTQGNIAIFSVRAHTPWRRLVTYDVPAKMPPCPPRGCICAWVWIPNGCGEPNIYMQGYRCKVSNSISNIPVAAPKPAVWCEGAPEKCTKGAKQIIGWNQKSGNNIQVEGYDLAGVPKSPGYNSKCGFSDGAQNDIFATSVPVLAEVPASAPTSGGSRKSTNAKVVKKSSQA